MRVAIFQMIMIESMIKVEFKLTVPNDHGAYVKKMINSKEDYEAFKKELVEKITSLDLIIHNKLERINGKTANTAVDTAKA